MNLRLLLILPLLLASCSSLPEIRPSAVVAGKVIACPSPFVARKTLFIHAVEAAAAGETRAVMIGVTVADPASRTLSCALMSPEGMVLFEASRNPSGTQISRALPPFDEEEFARGLLDDIELIFFEPPEPVDRAGFSDTGRFVCRRRLQGGGWLDVGKDGDGRVQIRRYSKGGTLRRSVALAAGANPYAAIELQASEWIGYSLSMTLVEPEAVLDEALSGK
ncbi:MAG: hypothetical protein PHW80_05235 [Smithellaceae bacterium]|jgi:hypothetical protein|nr:hypothetical protein [Smithellaceae bacterium]MDD3848685.1 hypothetical protein [Smithellaceae bacterium]HOG11547.1 hypothetical protein [Smithellaceae bacterium]HOQ71532.1 hypothetical protein [Smithellaceae bacterium]HPL09888.1 hypothetical protein [Smithellaceae bacterium]